MFYSTFREFPYLKNAFSRFCISSYGQLAYFCKKIQVKRGYLLVLAVIYTSLVFGQHGNIRGKVVTSDNKAAPDVSVIVEPGKIGVLSDDEGSFTIQHVKPGTYYITASHVALQTVQQQVEAHENETSEISFVLKVSSIQLQEVIVETKKSLNERPDV
jgi:iron complex outermembrane recepter protein